MQKSKSRIKTNLILASASPRRARLLRQLGFKFTVFPSEVREKRKIKTTCAALVRENALNKARAIARKFGKGIVIGADTVVLVKNRVIGKPRNYSQAREFLKLFSWYPHSVYTGLAIIDAESGRYWTEYEKTRVIFHKLSEQEIDMFLSRSMSLDRAGGIDIEGKARKLVKEIRGDYYNVVGLPLRKLECLLRKIKS